MDTFGPTAYLVVAIFTIGYLFIIFEHKLHINKATSALMASVLMWFTIFIASDFSYQKHVTFLEDQLADITQVVLFLLGALSIVEIINAHKGFSFVSKVLQVPSKKKLFWMLGIMTFFLSAALDNLTTTIVMVTLLRRIVPHTVDRWLMGAGVVIAANAGGAWTPIGDVTTTMLWIGGQLSTFNIMYALFIPSLVCMILSFIVLSFSLKGHLDLPTTTSEGKVPPHGKAILVLGVALLLFVPFFKLMTGLPPFMGMLFGLAVLWMYTDIVHHRHYNRGHLRVISILKEVDLSSVIFFLGILLAVGALDEVGFLAHAASWLQGNVPNEALMASFVGVFSAMVDNVPLVAATMGMFKLSSYPQDAPFWEMIAYCAGTGGSMLVIGSAAGVVFMGIEKVDFVWYMKRVTLSATIGYFGGLGAYLLLVS